jgi:hypothetical protein
MAIYSLANRTTNATTTQASFELIGPAAARVRLMEIGIWLNAATQSPLGLGRPQAIGVTPTSPINVLAEDPNDSTGGSRTALAWSTPPTVPLNYFRRFNIAGAIGAGVIATFPRGLVIPAAGSVILWNIAAVSLYDVHVVVDE